MEAKVGCERLDGTLIIHPESEYCEVCRLELLRSIMNRIHEGGNIFNDAGLAPASKAQQERGLKENEKPILYGRFDAYKIVALIASNLRKEVMSGS